MEMKTIRQIYHINASLEVVWKALIDPLEIENWGGGPAKMNDKIGTKFSLWGGSIWGKNIKVIPEKELVQEWVSQEEKKWDKPSIVTFTLHAGKNGTQVDLLHKYIPKEYAKSIGDGWKEYYLGPLKEYVEKKQKREMDK